MHMHVRRLLHKSLLHSLLHMIMWHNFEPLSTFFNSPREGKSHGDNSGLYEGCSGTSHCMAYSWP
jgi:hypothetical protein